MSTGLERTRSLELEEIPGASAKWNLAPAALYEEAIRRGEGLIAADGPMVCRTGEHTGRSPKDKFLVREPGSEKDIAWGAVNRAMDPADFDTAPPRHARVAAARGIVRPGLLRRRGSEIPPADPRDHGIRVAQPVRPQPVDRRPRGRRGRSPTTPRFTIIDSPSFKADPARHGTRSEVVIALNFAKRLVLIAGTSYAGEIKKSVFTDPQRPPAARGRALDALLGEYRTGGRRGAVLRALRHRQDDAVERSRSVG